MGRMELLFKRSFRTLPPNGKCVFYMFGCGYIVPNEQVKNKIHWAVNPFILLGGPIITISWFAFRHTVTVILFAAFYLAGFIRLRSVLSGLERTTERLDPVSEQKFKSETQKKKFSGQGISQGACSFFSF